MRPRDPPPRPLPPTSVLHRRRNGGPEKGQEGRGENRQVTAETELPASGPASWVSGRAAARAPLSEGPALALLLRCHQPETVRVDTRAPHFHFALGPASHAVGPDSVSGVHPILVSSDAPNNPRRAMHAH